MQLDLRTTHEDLELRIAHHKMPDALEYSRLNVLMGPKLSWIPKRGIYVVMRPSLFELVSLPIDHHFRIHHARCNHDEDAGAIGMLLTSPCSFGMMTGIMSTKPAIKTHLLGL